MFIIVVTYENIRKHFHTGDHNTLMTSVRVKCNFVGRLLKLYCARYYSESLHLPINNSEKEEVRRYGGTIGMINANDDVSATYFNFI